MIDINAALAYMNRLWNEEVGAFREAVLIDSYHQNDNTLAWMVMRRYDPPKAERLRDGLLKDYIDPRWCILDGDAEHFVSGPEKLPDYLRYADLVALQYLYRHYRPVDEYPSANLCFGILGKMYGLKHEGYIYDMATKLEGYTTYKLLLYGMCALKHGHLELVKRLLSTCSQMQVRPDNENTLPFWRGDEIGGIKTEYIPPEWEGGYPHLLRLANCETTSLAILLQSEYQDRLFRDALMTAGGVAGVVGGLIAQSRYI